MNKTECAQHLARMGKGPVAAFKPAPGVVPWRGATRVSQPPFNPAQVEENRRLYPHLFGRD